MVLNNIAGQPKTGLKRPKKVQFIFQKSEYNSHHSGLEESERDEGRGGPSHQIQTDQHSVPFHAGVTDWSASAWCECRTRAWLLTVTTTCLVQRSTVQATLFCSVAKPLYLCLPEEAKHKLKTGSLVNVRWA
ncbi:hypothetical protein V6N13_103434 [Hibiscus sabdariffa]|uniref:Uncharacterized protein n=1 Tax=Hibiscus sabdariffa TaxID=183260 RepID=A0ABR2BHC7_9ROSI